MNDFQRANLVRHRDWLVANRDDIVGFDMMSYTSDFARCTVNSCGAPACVLGWTIRSMPELVAPIEFFSTVATELLGSGPGSDRYAYMFGTIWASLDNTLDGAIDRMTAVIDNDFTVPEAAMVDAFAS